LAVAIETSLIKAIAKLYEKLATILIDELYGQVQKETTKTKDVKSACLVIAFLVGN
jgi:hypothetical protein